jgi:hypothetical protein
MVSWIRGSRGEIIVREEKARYHRLQKRQRRKNDMVLYISLRWDGAGRKKNSFRISKTVYKGWSPETRLLTTMCISKGE